MSAEDKKEDLSSPNLEELDSAWDSDDEELDEDATTVQKIPKELVALSRRGIEDAAQAAKKTEEPEKHEAITARPPPNAEPSVVVDAPHEKLANAQERASIANMDGDSAVSGRAATHKARSVSSDAARFPLDRVDPLGSPTRRPLR